MSLEQIAQSMDIVFLALIDQLPEVGHFITPLEIIDMSNRPLPSATSLEPREKLLQGISLLGVRVQLKQRRINSVLLTARVLQWTLVSKGYFCACIPYGQLMLSGMLCNCLWDIQLTLPRYG